MDLFYVVFMFFLFIRLLFHVCIVYVNGDFLLEVDAKIFVFDCGWLFVDGVYEVIVVIDG